MGTAKARPDLKVVSAFFIDSSKAIDIARTVDFLVSTRSFRPELDKVMLRSQHDIFSRLASRSARELKSIAKVGTTERFEYSAEIFTVKSNTSMESDTPYR